MHALTHFGDVPYRLERDMRYDRVVARLRRERLIDEKRESNYSEKNNRQGRFVAFLVLVVLLAIWNLVYAYIFPVTRSQNVFYNWTSYDHILIFWGSIFIFAVFRQLTRNPDRDRLAFLYNFGTAVPGTLDMVRVDVRARGLRYELGYSFAGPAGESCEGSMMVYHDHLSPDEKRWLKDRADVTVLYHPECPALNVIRLEKGAAEFELRRSPLPPPLAEMSALGPAQGCDPTR